MTTSHHQTPVTTRVVTVRRGPSSAQVERLHDAVGLRRGPPPPAAAPPAARPRGVVAPRQQRRRWAGGGGSGGGGGGPSSSSRWLGSRWRRRWRSATAATTASTPPPQRERDRSRPCGSTAPRRCARACVLCAARGASSYDCHRRCCRSVRGVDSVEIYLSIADCSNRESDATDCSGLLRVNARERGQCLSRRGTHEGAPRHRDDPVSSSLVPALSAAEPRSPHG